MTNPITKIEVGTNTRLYDRGEPMTEAIWFHRGEGVANNYYAQATSPSFVRAVWAMMRLAERKHLKLVEAPAPIALMVADEMGAGG